VRDERDVADAGVDRRHALLHVGDERAAADLRPVDVARPDADVLGRLGAHPEAGAEDGVDVVLSSPASARAFRAASAWSANADFCGSFPCSSASAAPTIATRPRMRRRSRVMRAGSAAARRRRDVLERHLDRHADADRRRVGRDADEVRHEPRPLGELDDRDDVRRGERENRAARGARP
jgi:hypothetical protein